MKKIFYGNVLVVVLGLMYFCSSGIILPAANVINPLMLEDASMELNGTLLSAGFSLFVLFQGISAPVIGSVIERIGARYTMVLGAGILAAASLAMAFVVSSPIGYLICFGVMASVGAMMAGQLSTQSTVGAWFVARRGMAMTATMFIGASSAFLLPTVIEFIISESGGSWRSGWYLLIGLSLAMIPLALLMVKNKPSDMGLLPDGASDAGDMADKRQQFKVYKSAESLPFSRVIRSRAFWLIALTATAGFAAYSFATSQGMIHFTNVGIDRPTVVMGVSLMGGASLAGKLVMGSLSDRVEPVRIMSVAALLIALGVFVAAFASNTAMMLSYYFCTGFGFGAITATFPTTIANYFGSGSFSKNLGIGIFVTTIIASVLPIISGFIFDMTGSCSPAFVMTGVVVTACAVCGFFVQFPGKD